MPERGDLGLLADSGSGVAIWVLGNSWVGGAISRMFFSENSSPSLMVPTKQKQNMGDLLV